MHQEFMLIPTTDKHPGLGSHGPLNVENNFCYSLFVGNRLCEFIPLNIVTALSQQLLTALDAKSIHIYISKAIDGFLLISTFAYGLISSYYITS